MTVSHDCSEEEKSIDEDPAEVSPPEDLLCDPSELPPEFEPPRPLNFLRLIRWTREASCSVASVCCTCLGEGDMCTTMAAWQVTEPSASFSNIVSLFSL